MEALVALPQQRFQRRSVEAQKVHQPAAEVGIASGTGQRDALQQPQAVCRRQPAVFAHPAVDGEQRQRQSPSVEADADQVGQRLLRPAAPEQVHMAVFVAVPMAVVEALGAAAGIHQVARGVVLVLARRGSGGEGVHQGPLAFDQPQPVKESLLGGSVAGPGVPHQWEAPHPPSWAPQPDGFSFAGEDDGFAGGFVVLVALPRAAGRLVLLWLWASCRSGGAAASADGTARAAAEIAALARPWRRRSTSRRERRGMRISGTEPKDATPAQFFSGVSGPVCTGLSVALYSVQEPS